MGLIDLTASLWLFACVIKGSIVRERTSGDQSKFVGRPPSQTIGASLKRKTRYVSSTLARKEHPFFPLKCCGGALFTRTPLSFVLRNVASSMSAIASFRSGEIGAQLKCMTLVKGATINRWPLSLSYACAYARGERRDGACARPWTFQRCTFRTR